MSQNHQEPDRTMLDSYQESNIDIQRYLGLIRAKLPLFCGIALCVMTCAVVASYVLPKKYEAKSTVFIEQNVINDLVKGIAVTPSMEAKIKVLKVAMLSRTMLLEVIRELDMDLSVKTDSELEELIDTLQKQTRISLDEERGVFTISYTNTDPRLASNFVNTLVRRYIEENTSSKREESLEATRFLAEQIDTFKQRIDKADANINAFKQEKGMVLALDEAIVRKEIDDVQNELEALNIREHELQATRNLLSAKTHVVVQTDTERLQLEKQLAELRTQYSESHPDVRRAVKALEALPSGSAKRVTRSSLSDKDQRELELAGIELSAVKKNKDLLHNSLEEKKQILREIPVVQTELAELKRTKENETLIYQQLVARYGQSEVSKQMELQDKAVSFRVIDPAVMPTSHVSPKRPLIIGGGIAAGFGLALGVLILLDMFNQSIHSQDQLRSIHIPVLASIPRIGRPDHVSARTIGLFAVCGVYFLCILTVLSIEVLGLPYIENAIPHIGIEALKTKLMTMIL
ncbi:XrtA system polysaccharide chain length determinant [Oceanidesulfovibrio marinus]|uniref:Polysaccharide chain length determinant protein n=1 Tax=Oceanidesulfovibrio marinus TaxID=370038 RepID=A0ABX6NBJ4_9BACT|nr:XrtA system polysaccharide chain length determinant [Oceanidesulfovibrio marinus]QJT07964.1 polysaccharide chain length determinant protein [Oceanidesulfovibrio marinus]